MRAGNLFAASEAQHFRKAQPLAARMRARTLEEFVGQQHFIGQGKLLYRMLKSDRSEEHTSELQSH